MALKTPEMKACIENSFATDGCFRQMRSSEMQLATQLREAPIEEIAAIIQNIKIAEFVEELAATSDSDSE